MKNPLPITLLLALLISFTSCQKNSPEAPEDHDTPVQLTKITKIQVTGNELERGKPVSEELEWEIVYDSKNVVSELKRLDFANVSYLPKYNKAGQLIKIFVKSFNSAAEPILTDSLIYNSSGQLVKYEDYSMKQTKALIYGSDGKVRTVNTVEPNGGSNAEYTWKGDNISQIITTYSGYYPGSSGNKKTEVFENYKSHVDPYRLGGQMLEILTSWISFFKKRSLVGGCKNDKCGRLSH